MTEKKFTLKRAAKETPEALSAEANRKVSEACKNLNRFANRGSRKGGNHGKHL